jgi:4-hydroxybenzoate polyprenyltransferase
VKRLIEELRPKQWYKQGVIFVPLLFSKNLTNIDSIISILIATISFCLISSSVYIINDISDAEEDREHPVKKHRPIASGDVSIRLGIVTALLLFIISVGLGYILGLLFLAVILIYFIQNLLYSYWLKRIAFIDILMISFGFVLRSTSGAVAISEPVSPWLISCIGFLALLLGVGKRKNEIQTIDDSDSRNVLKQYKLVGIDRIMTVVVTTLISVYALYTFTYEYNLMIVTVPSVIFALFRYMYLVQCLGIGSKPYKLIKDKQFVANILLWFLLTLIVLYRGDYIVQFIVQI